MSTIPWTLTRSHGWADEAAYHEIEKATRAQREARAAAARSIALRSRILGNSGPKLRAAILRAIAVAVGGATLRSVSAALQERDLLAAQAAIPWERFETILSPVARVELRAAIEQSGSLEGRLLLEQLGNRAGAFAFDVTHSATVEWVRVHGAGLVTNISESRRNALKRILDKVVRGGLNEHDAARMILDGKAIGLTEREAGAVANYRARLRQDGVRVDSADTLAARYSKKLLAGRATRIAHHELVEAFSEGQVQGWAQARQARLLDDRTVVRWNALFDAEAICQRLAGKFVRIGQAFPGGFRRPPAHIGCRCILTVHPFGLPARRR